MCAPETAAQSAIDLALLMVSERGLGPPSSYRETFGLLAAAGVVESDLSEQLMQWASFRNVLVHLYTALDHRRVVAALSETEPLRRFHQIASQELAAGSAR